MQLKFHMVTIEDLVPEGHFLRKVNAVNVELKREAFQYDERLDAYVCPNGKLLNLNTLHRSASGLYWLYLADKQDCQRCPLRKKCLSQQDKHGARKLEHSYFAA